MAGRVGRSLKISEEGKEKAQKALTDRCLTQKELAKELGFSRETVSKFFRGLSVDRQYFVNICEELRLEWDEIAAKPASQAAQDKKQQDSASDIDALVQEVREKRHDKIQDQCGTMRMLYISQPVALADIYTDVNILEQITSQQWREISDLARHFNPELDNFNRLGLGEVRQQGVPGLDAVSRYSKLMVLGKPGAGKTTFLRWVAIKCNLGEFQSNRVPIFIWLKNFAEDTRTDDSESRLLNYIIKEFRRCGIADKSVIETILTEGRTIMLLDGLDEVSEEDADDIVRQIRRFAEDYFKNQYIITCRIAAQKSVFQGFTDVEVADFNSEQVEAFAKKWFVAVARNNHEEGEVTARQFIRKLNLLENKQILELAVTPILLNLTCSVFEVKGEFPSKRYKLYEQGLYILLKKWDESRNIKRHDFYRNLSLEDKIELLTQVAALTFEKSRYFFEQDEVERCIADYLCTLPNAQSARLTLKRDSKAVLKGIEAQCGLLVERSQGIYSFSHLTFQEYFAARKIFANSAWESLVEHITEKRWREVFLLTAGMMQKADELLWLMKRKVDDLLAGNEKLQRFLGLVNEKAVNEKAKSVEVRYKCAAVRAFYLASLNENFIFLFGDIDRQYQPGFKFHKSRDFSSDICFTKAGNLIRIFIKIENFIIDFELLISSQIVEHNIQNILKKVQEQIPNPYNDQERFDQWIKDNSQAWTEQLRKVIVKHPNLGHDCQFSEAQKELLRQYYDANKLLVDCLNSDCYISPELREEIEDTLLLPMAEIEKRQQRIL